eukprot:CAMPEP_0113637784 /NCGR_PEP_ID=MMETSP0017_2-20120614/19789_1 /TAXON_ID=2856 /ORGANISM="Cylindrotheca closterium" /LENGTH=531 /DNA_ID=CAMNT_0000548851 /DNA_START=52 /DNA_END=1650 /DNA_ORIENTATION=+ /assembly_acc=CAM_ASM_000147
MGVEFQTGHVRLVEDEEDFRASFDGFEDGTQDGFSEQKLQYRGKIGLVVEVFDDETVTIDFEDGSANMDFPFETIAEQIDIVACDRDGPLKFQTGHVRLVEDEEDFRASFDGFEDGTQDGFSEQKLQYMGKIGLAVEIFEEDKTATIDFGDGSINMDFPFEAIAEQVDTIECDLFQPVSEEEMEHSGVVAREKYGNLTFEEFSALFHEAFDVTSGETFRRVNGNAERRVELIALLQVALEMAVDGMVHKRWDQAADSVYMVQKYRSSGAIGCTGFFEQTFIELAKRVAESKLALNAGDSLYDVDRLQRLNEKLKNDTSWREAQKSEVIDEVIGGTEDLMEDTSNFSDQAITLQKLAAENASEFVWRMRTVMGTRGNIKSDLKADASRIVAKMEEYAEEEEYAEAPYKRVYDSMRCTIEVKSIDDLESVVNDILTELEGYVLNVKPKLDTPLLNVTIHSLCEVDRIRLDIPKGDDVMLQVPGEIQVRLLGKEDPCKQARHFLYKISRCDNGDGALLVLNRYYVKCVNEQFYK